MLRGLFNFMSSTRNGIAASPAPGSVRRHAMSYPSVVGPLPACRQAGLSASLAQIKNLFSPKPKRADWLGGFCIITHKNPIPSERQVKSAAGADGTG